VQQTGRRPRRPTGRQPRSGSRAASRRTGGYHRLSHAIAAARQAGKPIGICGQAPSDYPELAAWLVGLGIDSISLNPDVAIRTTMVIHEAEAARHLLRQGGNAG
jgi:signal transduction protein with GAF and PtsI domain